MKYKEKKSETFATYHLRNKYSKMVQGSYDSGHPYIIWNGISLTKPVIMQVLDLDTVYLSSRVKTMTFCRAIA